MTKNCKKISIKPQKSLLMFRQGLCTRNYPSSNVSNDHFEKPVDTFEQKKQEFKKF